MSTIPARPTRARRASGGAVIALLLVGIPTAILRAWVLQFLWRWFVTPTFHVAVPKIAVLYVLTWVIGLMWPTPPSDDETLDGTAVATFFFKSVFISLFGLAVGAVAHAFA